MSNLPNLRPEIMASVSASASASSGSCNCKYLDVVDLTADNISCNTLSINGDPFDPINPDFTTATVDDILQTKSIEVINRDLSLCDTLGNGNPGTDPNSESYSRHSKFWGYSEFYSMLMIKRRQNPADYYNFFGPCLQIVNEYQKTTYLSDGKFRPAYTSSQFGHDFNLQVNGSMTQFIYFGPGNYKNKLVTDANGLIASEASSFCMQMPCLRLDVNANGVIPAGGVSCAENSYPSAALTANTSTITGQGYGNGQYIVLSSYTWVTGAFALFNKDTTGDIQMSTSGSYQSNGVNPTNAGLYVGPTTTTVGGVSYLGEWVQIRLPVQIIPSKVILTRRYDGSRPRNTVLLGSNDGTTWDLLRNSSDLNYTNHQATISTTVDKLYDTFRLVVTRVGLSNIFAYDYASLAEIGIYSNTVKININSSGYVGAIPNPGQYVSILATPSTLSVDYAPITEVSVGATVSVFASVSSMVPATSTDIESVYFGPRVSSDGTTTISVTFDNGPLPEEGQYIKVTTTNTAYNTAVDGNPITSVTVGSLKTTVTYVVATAVPLGVATVTACSLRFDDPSVIANAKGIYSNVGIHNSDPQAPLDVSGNVIFRDQQSKYPLLKTTTDSVDRSEITFLDSTQSGQKQMCQIDCKNKVIRFKNPAQSSGVPLAGTLFEVDSANSLMTTYKSDTSKRFLEQNSNLGQQTFYSVTDGTTKFMLIDSSLSRVAIGAYAVANIGSYGGFVSSAQSTFTGNTRIESPASFVCGAANSYLNFRVDNTLNRVSVLTATPQYEFHVAGESYRQYPHVMAMLQNSSQAIPNATLTPLLWTARDTVTEYGPVGVRTSGTGTALDPFVNAGLGLTLSPTTGRFTYATMGGITKKIFRVEAQVIFQANATGFRQTQIGYYNSSGTLIRNYSLDIRDAAAGSSFTSINMSTIVSISNGESFDVSVYQNSTASLNTISATPSFTNIQIYHA